MTFGEDWKFGANLEESRKVFDLYREKGCCSPCVPFLCLTALQVGTSLTLPMFTLTEAVSAFWGNTYLPVEQGTLSMQRL